MLALHVASVVSTIPMHEYAPSFRAFPSLAMLHLRSHSAHRPQPNLLSDKDFVLQSEQWTSSARGVAAELPSLDFLGWHGEHYIVVRSGNASEKGARVELKELPARRRLDCGKGVDLGCEDAVWMERRDVPMDYEMAGLEA